MSLLLLFHGSFNGVTGTLALAEANDTISAPAVLRVAASLSATEAGDTFGSTATMLIKGALLVTEANDVLAATGTIAIKASAGVIETNDTSSATGTIPLKAAAAIIEGNATPSANAIVPAQANLAITEDSDTVTSSFFPVLQLRTRGGPWPVPGDEPAWRIDDWNRDLRRVIEEAWRVANGEIDPITRLELPPPPEPDYTAIHEALASRATAAEQDRADRIRAVQERTLEDEAVAILLLAA